MSRALLLLYRSARHPALAEAGARLERAAARPGLHLLATEDHYTGSDEIRRRAAARAGARPRCSTDWATGGWFRTRYAVRQR